MIKLHGGHQSLDKPFISYYCALTELLPLGKNDLSQPRLGVHRSAASPRKAPFVGSRQKPTTTYSGVNKIFEKVILGLFASGLRLFCLILPLITSLFAPVNNSSWGELFVLNQAPRRERDLLIGLFRCFGGRRRTDSTVLGRARGKRMTGQPSYPKALRK